MSIYEVKDSPCYKCTKRYSGCHSKCDRYIFFCRKRDELKKLKEKAWYSNPPHRKGE